MLAPIITSVVDSDLYKFTMGQAVAKRYPRARVRYDFINRGNTLFPAGFADELKNQIEYLSQLRMTKDERDILTQKCGRFLDPVYIDMILSGYQFDPREVSVAEQNGKLQVSIEGNWARTIYWEVPLMALISELYFKLAPNPVMQENKILTEAESYSCAWAKGDLLKKNKCRLMEFGTRRRVSLANQRIVLRALKSSMGEYLTGTSNVRLGIEEDLIIHGTQAHEWISGIAALEGLEYANRKAMQEWSQIYQGDLGISLTDTFGLKSFLKDFNRYYAMLFQGVRHDSGDPFHFAETIIAHYKSIGIDPSSKVIVFSDGLSVNKCIEIQNRFSSLIKIIFGVGTHLTNDVGYLALNIVIKLLEINKTPVIKLSDSSGKETGDDEYIKIAKKLHHV